MKTIKKTIMLLAAMLTAWCASPQMARASVVLDENNFPDASLRAFLSYKFSVGEGYTIYDDQINSTTSLFIDNYRYPVNDVRGLEKFPNLEILYIEYGTIEKVNLSQFPKLTYFDGYNLGIKELTPAPTMTAISCGKNSISRLDLSACQNMGSIHAGNNQLTELILPAGVTITNLDCSHNLLTELDLSGVADIQELDCSYNQLTQIKLPSEVSLTQLNVNNNQLASLSLPAFSASGTLSLNIYCNQFDDAAMTEIINALPDKTGNASGFYALNYYDGAEQNVCTREHVSLLKAKGWDCYIQDENTRDQYSAWQKFFGFMPHTFTATMHGATITFKISDLDALEAYAYSVADCGETLEIPETVSVKEQGSEEEYTFTVTKVDGGGAQGSAGRFAYQPMKTLILPRTIKDYSYNCFMGCGSLEKVYNYTADAVNAYYNLFGTDKEKFVMGNSTYTANYDRATLYVPFGSEWAYQRTNPWRMFGTIVEGTEEESLSAAPVFSVEGGTFSEPVTVTLSNGNGEGDIYYYLTGEDNQSQYWSYLPEVKKYDGPIELGSSGIIAAYVTDGTKRSPVRKENYEITGGAVTVAGMMVTGSNSYDVLGDKGSVAYDMKSGVLTLSNTNFDTGEYKADTGIEAPGGDLTIELIGDNVINAQYQGISFGYGGGTGTGGTLTIRTAEKFEPATLTINMNGKGGTGIFGYLASVNIENCTVIINGGTEGISYKAGGKGDGVLSISNATLDISAENSAMTGVFDLQLSKDISITSPEGATFVATSFKDKEVGGNIMVDGDVSAAVTIGPKQEEIELAPVEEETVISIAEGLETGKGEEPVDLNNTVVNNVYYTIDNTTNADEPDGYYDSEEQCIVINATTSSVQMATVVDNEPGTAEVVENYTGIIIQVPAGQGVIIVNTETTGSNYVAVQVGNDAPTTEQTSGREDVEVNYNNSEDTYVYIYATNEAGSNTPQQNSLRIAPLDMTGKSADAVKIYSITVKPGEDIPTSIDTVAKDEPATSGQYCTLEGKALSGKPSQEGIYVSKGKKIAVIR